MKKKSHKNKNIYIYIYIYKNKKSLEKIITKTPTKNKEKINDFK